MGLFGRHDYGRDYRGEGRGFGDRTRGDRNRFGNRMEGGMHRGYDRGMRGGGYGPVDFAYRGLDDAWSTGFNRGAHDVQWDWRVAAGNPYDQDNRRPSGGGYGRDYRAGRAMGDGYDRDFGALRPTGAGWYPASRPPYGRHDRYDAGYRGWDRGRR
ncbi:MAG TPA: hypothetical protein VGO40_19315 [Longimicrobium sp.]|jgi:hypothetical protein|nr:hypothetical protein [Longimicrobium sp.]